MSAQKSNEKPLAVVEIRKGMIEEVYTNVPLKVLVVDWDTQGVEEGTPGVLSVPLDDAIDRTELCFAACLRVRSLTRLSRNLRHALQDRGYLPAACTCPKGRKGSSSATTS